MPSYKPCPHCGLMIEDWHREWYSLSNQVLLFQHKAAADCPNPGCGGGVDLYAKTDTVPPADVGLPIVARSKKTGGDLGDFQCSSGNVSTNHEPGATVFALPLRNRSPHTNSGKTGARRSGGAACSLQARREI